MRGRRLWDVGVPMRDGVRLSADVILPAGGVAGGPYPALLNRTPYDNQGGANRSIAEHLAEHGYAVVLQDIRGRSDSEGSWVPFRNEGPDGYDTIEWIADQPWCSGRVGTWGTSYEGWTQWAAARLRPPHLVAMVSTAASGDWMREVPFHNGVLSLALFPWLNAVSGRGVQLPNLVADELPDLFRHLPLREMDRQLGRDLPAWRDWLDHPTLDDYWQQLRLDDDFASIDLPVLHITGWYDGDQPGALYFHRGMTTKSPRPADQRLLIGPWNHGGTRIPQRSIGGVDFGADAVADIKELHRNWFDRWLRADQPGAHDGDHDDEHSAAVVDLPPCRVFNTGVNAWRDLPTWPPDGTSVTWYLHSGGRANTLAGDGWLDPEQPTVPEPADEYVYDPENPVPGTLDERFYSPDQVETPLDHRFKHRRDDVLVYTAPTADSQLTVVGQPVLHLFATTDGPDTDFFAALHDVSPTGTSVLLAEGQLRGRFRAGPDHEQLLEPGTCYEFEFTLGGLCHTVLIGHRLRLTVTSSDFPVWDRNTNTGEPIATATRTRIANNHVLHEPDRPSRLVLTVLTDHSDRPA